eukprot:COSAG02_NODE_21398_length_789_cov_2.708696_1_plen_80_part_00
MYAYHTVHWTSGLDWTGLDWTGRVDWTGLDWTGLQYRTYSTVLVLDYIISRIQESYRGYSTGLDYNTVRAFSSVTRNFF